MVFVRPYLTSITQLFTGLLMKIYCCVLACACTCISELAGSQAAVSFADLQGTIIHTEVLFQQEGLRNGQPFANQFDTAMTITIDSANSLTNTTVDTAHNPEGGRPSAPKSGSFTLGK